MKSPKESLSKVFNKEVVTSLRTGLKSAKLGLDVVTFMAKAYGVSLIAPAAVVAASGGGALIGGVLLATLVLKKASQSQDQNSFLNKQIQSVKARVPVKVQDQFARVAAKVKRSKPQGQRFKLNMSRLAPLPAF